MGHIDHQQAEFSNELVLTLIPLTDLSSASPRLDSPLFVVRSPPPPSVSLCKMLLSKIGRRNSYVTFIIRGCRHLTSLSHLPSHSLLSNNNNNNNNNNIITPKGLGYYHYSSTFIGFGARHQIHQQTTSPLIEDHLDPFSLVADELSIIADRLRSMVVAEVPNLASAAEYFFKTGVEGKRFRPTVLLLMASALNVNVPESLPNTLGDNLTSELRTRQQCIAEITEMIHVASLLHDDVLDDAETRRGIGSLNVVMGNKLSVLAGDFLLSRACVALASLKNTEVVSLLATVVEHLVTGETMQMTTSSDQRCSMDYYMQKTYYKTASLISNSCKAIALLAGQTTEAAMLAFEYGKNLGLAFQLIDDVLDFTGTSTSLGKGSLTDIRHGIVTAPILFAVEEFPQLRDVLDKGFNNPANVDIALDYLSKSRGIQKTMELAMKHANIAASAIESLPESDDEDVRKSRRALIELTQIVITRNK
ncbi:hypothetical protein ACFE04_030085 [Oxalis oulophora]